MCEVLLNLLQAYILLLSLEEIKFNRNFNFKRKVNNKDLDLRYCCV